MLFIAYLFLLAMVYLVQGSLLYHPTHDTMTPVPKSFGVEELYIKLENSEKIHAWKIEKEGNKGYVIYCHGNAGNLGDRMARIQDIAALGLNVIIFDYRGYGLSDGTPSESNMYEEVGAVWSYLVDQGINPDEIISWGHSLGGSVATHLAKTQKTRVAIIESTFTSIRDVASDIYPFLPSFICRYNYPSLENLKAYEGKVLLMHGPNDEVIPYKHGVRIKEETQPEMFLELAGGHNDGSYVTKGYTATIKKFLQEYFYR
jgi:fermentation-respiration switch protein FrsA (DUF1100 family)